MEYVIQTLLDINEKLSENIDENNNNSPQSGIDLISSFTIVLIYINLIMLYKVSKEFEKEPMGESNKFNRSGYIYQCKVCNYSSDHPANIELHEKAHNNNNTQGNGTYLSHNNNSLSLSGKFMSIYLN